MQREAILSSSIGSHDVACSPSEPSPGSKSYLEWRFDGYGHHRWGEFALDASGVLLVTRSNNWLEGAVACVCASAGNDAIVACLAQ